MSDRVPIGTFPGSVSGLVGFDSLVATFGRAARISRLFLARTGHLAPDVVSGSIRNAAAGGGSGLAFSFPAGAESVVASGSLAVGAADSVYLRVTASDVNSQDLRGWFEVTGAAGVTTALTSLQRVKDWRGITGTAFDPILEAAIAGVSARIQTYLRRRIVAETLVAELYDGPPMDTLTLRAYPILDSGALVVRESGVVVPTSEYVIRSAPAQLVRISPGGWSGAWERGRLNLSVDYEAGFDEVPEDLAQAATRQAAYLSLETPAGNLGRLGNRGTVLAEGGTSEYTKTAWVEGVLETLDSYRDRRMI